MKKWGQSDKCNVFVNLIFSVLSSLYFFSFICFIAIDTAVRCPMHNCSVIQALLTDVFVFNNQAIICFCGTFFFNDVYLP